MITSSVQRYNTLSIYRGRDVIADARVKAAIIRDNRRLAAPTALGMGHTGHCGRNYETRIMISKIKLYQTITLHRLCTLILLDIANNYEIILNSCIHSLTDGLLSLDLHHAISEKDFLI